MAASKYDRLDPSRLLHRNVTNLTTADVLSTARTLRLALRKAYVPHIIDRILHEASYLPGMHVRVTGFTTVTGSLTYLATDPLPDSRVERVRVRTVSRNAGARHSPHARAAASYTWWALRVCAPGEVEIVGRRLFARVKVPKLWAHLVNGDSFETHECDIDTADEYDHLAQVVRTAAPGQCVTLVAQGYPEFANCCQEAELSVFTPLGFDLETSPRLWEGARD